MATIVTGIATSHTPQLSMGSTMWAVHSGLVDHRVVDDFDERRANAPARLLDEVVPDRMSKKYDECQVHLDHLRAVLRDAKPDVVVVFGDDHREVFQADCSPSLAIFTGDEVWDLPTDMEGLLVSQQVSEWAYHGDSPVRYETAGALGTHIARELAKNDFDPAVLESLPEGRSLGHAFTFVKRRVGQDFDWAMLPIWVNAFYLPNRPSAKRCFALGQAVRAAIESWPGDERVAIVASGGLSHYLVDETFDQHLLSALRDNDGSALAEVHDDLLESGSGEIRMWISAAGALEGLKVTSAEYVPGYRSEVGTGVGLGFAVWA